MEIGTGQLLGVALAGSSWLGSLGPGAVGRCRRVVCRGDDHTGVQVGEAVAPASLPGRILGNGQGIPTSGLGVCSCRKGESSSETSIPRLPAAADKNSEAAPTEGQLTRCKRPSSVPVRRQPVMIGGMQVDVSRLPLQGNPQAKHLMVELVDYTCLHCRHFHHMLTVVRQRYGDQVAIVLRPVALNPQCNSYVQRKSREHADACEYSKLALAVWRMDPGKFSEFHDWLMGSEKIPSISVAKKRAVRLVGVDVLLKEINGKAVQEMLEHNHQIFHGTKKGLPIMITNAGSLSGVPKSAKQLYEPLEKYLNLQPVSPLELKDKG